LRIPIVLCLALVLGLPHRDEPAAPRWFAGSTVKHCQLTGDEDRPRRMPTPTQTGRRAGVIATDLGSSFEHEGRLYFLFGDTHGGPRDADVIAWTDARTLAELDLTFPVQEGGAFVPLQVPGVRLGAFEVPSYGISHGGEIFVVFTTDHTRRRTMGRSVVATSRDQGRTFAKLCDLSTTHFVNVALASARSAPGLPGEGGVLLWGSGDYRRSSPRLAWVPSLREASGLRYFRGLRDGMPSWGQHEEDAVPLFVHAVVGELSVAWIEPLRRWVMLYNSSRPRGIVMRTAELPWGPWSDAEVIFDPHRDGGYAGFLHVSWANGKLDAFHDPGREREWGGEYGPYLIPRFCTGDATRCTLVYTMSTWNPYQVVVMSSDVGQPDRVEPRRTSRTLTLPTREPWRGGGAFRPFERAGAPHVTTYGERGDAGTGAASWLFTCGEEAELTFALHGGFGEVVLVEEPATAPPPAAAIGTFYRDLKAGRHGKVLEAIAGPGQNERDVRVRWHLRRHHGRALRLYLVDALQGPWGFVSTSQFVLEQVSAR
jgi:hypothetical protein